MYAKTRAALWFLGCHFPFFFYDQMCQQCNWGDDGRDRCQLFLHQASNNSAKSLLLLIAPPLSNPHPCSTPIFGERAHLFSSLARAGQLGLYELHFLKCFSNIFFLHFFGIRNVLLLVLTYFPFFFKENLHFSSLEEQNLCNGAFSPSFYFRWSIWLHNLNNPSHSKNHLSAPHWKLCHQLWWFLLLPPSVF